MGCEKTIESLHVRTKALKDSLYKLEIQQADQITILNIEGSQEIIKKMMVNSERIDSIK